MLNLSIFWTVWRAIVSVILWKWEL